MVAKVLIRSYLPHLLALHLHIQLHLRVVDMEQELLLAVQRDKVAPVVQGVAVLQTLPLEQMLVLKELGIKVVIHRQKERTVAQAQQEGQITRLVAAEAQAALPELRLQPLAVMAELLKLQQ